jgi:hypothetical protein
MIEAKQAHWLCTLLEQALPRLSNRERLVQTVDLALKGQFAVKDLIQVKISS